MKRKALVIGIAGGSASGKSTLCTKLAEALSKYSIKEIHMDDYFKSEQQRPISTAPITGKSYMDDNHPDTIDMNKLKQDLAQSMESNLYQIIIIEGLLTLWENEIYNRLDLKLYVDCPADERIIRRLNRNMKWGQSFDEVSNVYLDLVRYRHNEYVEPSKWKADLIFNGSHPSDTALLIIETYIQQSITI